MSGLWVLIFLTLFFSGFTTLVFLKNRNLLVVLMAFELMFFSVGIAFAYCSILFFDFKGLIYAVILLAVAAGEAAIGLAILMMLYKREATIKINDFKRVRY